MSLATLDSLGDLWKNLQYDSFPLLWHVVLRSWRLVGLGGNDLSLRVLGLAIGLGLSGVLWWNSRKLGAGAPLVSLSLLGFGAAVIGYGDSLRGYGLGVLTGLVAYGQLWGVVDAPCLRRVFFALLASLAAVHCLFHNVVVLAACVLAGVVVCIRRRRLRRAAVVAGIGLLAAFSMLPYLQPIRQAREWNGIVRGPVSIRSLGGKLIEALSLSGAQIPWLWAALTSFSLLLAVYVQVTLRGAEAEDRRADRALFCAVALVAGVAGYAVFLMVLRYPTQPWYYLALLGLVATCVETALSALPRSGAGSVFRMAAAAALLVVAIPHAWRIAGTRKSNVDLVAARIEQEAQRGDLIVVSPWYLGVTFDRYYRGAAPWITLPPVPFHAFHRYDLLQSQMADPLAMDPLLHRIRVALGNGGRVWWVGDPPPLADGVEMSNRASSSRLAPRTRDDGPWYEFWGREAAEELRSASAHSESIRIGTGQAVSSYENAGLLVFRTLGATP